MAHSRSKEEEPPTRGAFTQNNNSHGSGPHGAEFSSSLPRKLKSRLLRLFTPYNPPLEKEVVELIAERDPEGLQVTSEERTMVHNVLNLGDMTVHDIMVPRTDIIAISHAISLPDLIALIVKEEHTRIPVYKGSLDNVIGFVHIKDLLPLIGQNKPFIITDAIRDILYVPPSMKVLDLLVRMKDKRIHMALVLDEYGATDGLVTMEDLMEEIVGEIEDEHDEISTSEIIELDDHTFEVSARVPIHELEEKLHLRLKDDKETEDFDTVGGLIFFLLGRVPDQGEIISHPNGVEFKIIDADPRRIKKLLIRNRPR